MKQKVTLTIEVDVENGEAGCSVKVDPPPTGVVKELTDALPALLAEAVREIKAKTGK